MNNNDKTSAIAEKAEKKGIIAVISKLKAKKPEQPKKALTNAQKIWIGAGSVVGVIAIAALIIALVASASNSVNVYPLENLAITDGWMYQSDNSGEVTGENIQTIYLSDTQTVTEVFVTEGQQVKVGDKIMSYDTTLSNLEIEKKNLEVLKLELALENAKRELYRINALKPYTPPDDESDDPIDLGVKITEMTLLDGSGTKADPYIYIVTESDRSLPCDEDDIDVLLGTSNSIYIVFETRKDDMSKGEITEAWGVCFTKLLTDRKLSCFDPTEFISEPDPIIPDDSSGYTTQQIAEMRNLQLSVIKEAEIEYRMANIEYQQMLLEVDTGVILSKVDGVVTQLNDAASNEYESDNDYKYYGMQTPFIKIAGGDGYRINASVNEYLLARLEIGQSLTVTSYDNGMTFDGNIVEIINLPTASDFYYYGGVSTSYYPVVISVSGDADFYEHQYVGVAFNSSTTESSLFVENAFIRTENGRSYAFILAENNKLEKRELVTGGNLWGNYTEVISGLTVEDMIAFPYGNSVKEGAKAVPSTIDELYSSLY